MDKFDEYNPIVIFTYFIVVTSLTIFCFNPIIILISLLGAIIYFNLISKNLRLQIQYFLLFILIALINPIFSHNGSTVLIVINDSPITLEAIVYGGFTSLMIITILYWFHSFNEIMTSDKLLYLFNKISPKFSLVLSMAFRYIPLFNKQSNKVKQTQTTLGLYKDGNIISRFIGGLRVFSIMITWALENGITTADSMSARGYGASRRTSYSIFKIRLKDIIVLFSIITLTISVIFNIVNNEITFTFYPTMIFPKLTIYSIIGYIAYIIIVLIPSINEVKERIKWKLLLSKI